MLLVLPRIGIERRHHGDPLGRCSLQRIDHDQLLHGPFVDRCAMTLDHKGVAAAYRLLKAHIDLRVGITDRPGGYDLDLQQLGHLTGQVRMRPPSEQHELLIVGALETAHDGSFCSSAASAARAVLLPARLRATHPDTLRCWLRLTASSPGPTLPVIVDPAAMYAPSAISIGATSTALLPTKSYA